MLPLANQLYRDGEGATAIEYALIAAFIAIAVVAAVLAVGESLQEVLFGVADSF